MVSGSKSLENSRGKGLKKFLGDKGKTIYNWVNKASGGVLGILVYTFRSFGQARAGDAAASIAYYALFSLFPLLIFLIAVGSSVFQSTEIQRQILSFVRETLPASESLVAGNIQQVLRLRGAVGVAGTVGLLWAATAVFTALARNINRAWPDTRPRSFLTGRLLALAMVGILTGLLVPSLIFSTVFSLLAQFSVPLWGEVSIYDTFAWHLLTRLIPWLLAFVTFQGLYRWVPRTKVRWSEAFWGALVAASAWEVTKSAFGWFISSGLVRHQLVYGSLGAVVALMLWIYLTSIITLFGAHLSAAITYHNDLKEQNQRGRKRRTKKP